MKPVHETNKKYVGTERCIQHLHSQLKNIAYEMSTIISKDIPWDILGK